MASSHWGIAVVGVTDLEELSVSFNVYGECKPNDAYTATARGAPNPNPNPRTQPPPERPHG